MNKNKKKEQNQGYKDPNDMSYEERRQIVMDQELTARSFKAHYDKMYYSLEAEKIEKDYLDYIKRTEERMEKERKEYIDQLMEMQKQMEATDANVPHMSEDIKEEIKTEENNG